MKILDRIRRAIARAGSSAGPAVTGGGAGAALGRGQIEAVERDEFPSEEFPADEQEESE